MFDLTQACQLNLKAEFYKEARVAAGSPVVEVSLNPFYSSEAAGEKL